MINLHYDDEVRSLLGGSEKDGSEQLPPVAPASSAQGRDFTVREARANIALYLLAGTIGSFGFVWASTDFHLLAIVAANTGTNSSFLMQISSFLHLKIHHF